MYRIIYRNDNGGISVITPANDVMNHDVLHFIAAKDVPTGKPYKIIDVADLPKSREQRDYWDVNKSDLTDGFGADFGVGSNWEILSITPFVVRHVLTGETREIVA